MSERVIGRCGVTEKLYEAVGEQYDFDATVVACRPLQDGYALVLDRTHFFPEGGGQSADTGTINGIPVTDVQIVAGELLHFVAQPLSVGETVHGELNAALRRQRMQHHTGEHILSGLAHAAHGCENVGFHLTDHEMTMDLSCPLTVEQLRALERQANEIIRENHAVHAAYPDAQTLAALPYRSKLELREDVRIVTIDGVDACACCAPHLATTGGVGVLRIVDSMSYKGGVRLWVACGERALRIWDEEHAALDAIARSFSVGRGDAAEAVARMQKELGELRGALGACRRELLTGRLRALAGGERHLLLFDGGEDANAMRYAAEQGAALCEGLCAVFSTPQEGTMRYVCISDHLPLRALSRQLHATLGGRGGGSDRMIQGSVTADEASLRAFFQAI